MTTQRETLEKSPVEQSVAEELARIAEYRLKIEGHLNEGPSHPDQTVMDFGDMNFFYGELAGLLKLRGKGVISEDLTAQLEKEFRSFENVKSGMGERIQKLTQDKQ